MQEKINNLGTTPNVWNPSDVWGIRNGVIDTSKDLMEQIIEKPVVINKFWDILSKLDCSWCSVEKEDRWGYDTFMIKKEGIDPKYSQLSITVNAGKLMINYTPYEFYEKHHYHTEKNIDDADLETTLAAAIKDVQSWWTDQQNLEAYGFTKISNEIDLSSYWY